MWNVASEGELKAGDMAAPGLLLLPRGGSPRLLGHSLLRQLDLEALPSRVGSLPELMAVAGFQRRAGSGSLWERDGQVLMAGEEALEDGALLLWTSPLAWDEAGVRRRVRYLSMASHDLRGSLANVRSYAALLLNGRVPLEPKVQRGLETILRNADRSLAFSQDFFDASRADLGSLPCEQERQSLLPLLDAAVERQRAAASAAQVALVLGLNPEQAVPEVIVDGARIQHAVESFIQYQLARAQPGEVIRLGIRDFAPRVRVEVRRDGAPLTDEDAAAVFQREERAFREKRLEDPLRVYLARQEVEAHGGSVGVESDRGGSTLFLTLAQAPVAALGSPATMQA
ncbi:sensor histidine kinase [Myxococcus xanthus DK 1622]|uniref:histidine kinase n=1 Tax=Myxococcus xanthus (strain DK1622) TaxID=246197 RepID=Q1D853_MYXXD|nr:MULTISPECIES: HAMP domain-containing sensor histidine kinase [Myxococcus]ABF91927.1 sensor histidine kinase [Myxococcus xanthus DK 1622]NOJ55190.1 HAMP domain-containing histidine kinase [Myxococcus xanthus]QPM82436.1 HAMP domain-containing histidine kinase [Myxococcus xanthus]QVW64741.1 HAMP domain-containing histidine kinase [Myxococcus xanthus DZ2]UEO02188.1 HAMP domain-containing histidine kinase [Myxococcus xanthus DZ2]